MLLLGLILQVCAGRWIVSPWWVPDFLLVSLVMGLLAAGGRRGTLIAWAAAAAMGLSVEHPVSVAAAYASAGAVVLVLAQRADLTEPRLQGVLLGILEAVLVGVGFALADRVSLALIGFGVVRVVMTLAAFGILRRVLGLGRGEVGR